jgi:hypothetical protein
MFKFNIMSVAVVGVSLGTLFGSPVAHATDTYNNQKTTTVEQTTTQTTSTAPHVVAKPVKKVAPVTTTTSNTTTLVTKDGELRKVLDEDALKKLAQDDGGVCVTGFKAYVGNDKKNVCQTKAKSPDIAYSCVWHEEGNAAFAPTPQGPCSLDYAEHQESIVVTKSEFTAGPPLPYGTEAQCCFRAAQGPATSTVVVSPTTTSVVHK